MLLSAQGFGPYITDDHPFRQTQTALVASGLGSLSDLLAYELPILGPPWAVPLEFPLYQALAKVLHVFSGWTLETSGRLVSMGFFALCFWPLAAWLREFDIRDRALVLAPVVLAPLYVFWSRAFLIETCALFFALLYGWRVTVALRAREASLSTAVGIALAGALAGLTKVTTFLPLLMAALAAHAWCLWARSVDRSTWGHHARIGLANGLALGVAALWVMHSDALKLEHPLGAYLTSSALRQWNFGSLSQRFDPKIWFALANNSVDMLFPMSRQLAWLKGSLALAWLALFVAWLRGCSVRRRWMVAGLCALFVLPFVVFTNVHRIHSYYQVANGVFLLLGTGLAAQGAMANAQRPKLVLSGVVALLVGLAGASAWYFHFKSSHQGQFLQASAIVREAGPPDAVTVISGHDWAPVIPYQSGRRALMITTSMFPQSAVEAALRQLRAGRYPIGLFVSCGSGSKLDAVAKSVLGIPADQPPMATADGCQMFQVPNAREG